MLLLNFFGKSVAQSLNCLIVLFVTCVWQIQINSFLKGEKSLFFLFLFSLREERRKRNKRERRGIERKEEKEGPLNLCLTVLFLNESSNSIFRPLTSERNSLPCYRFCHSMLHIQHLMWLIYCMMCFSLIKITRHDISCNTKIITSCHLT